jgi:hypothetical protein
LASAIWKKPQRTEAHSGWAITAQHVQSEFLGGKNKLALQYGEGSGTGWATPAIPGWITAASVTGSSSFLIGK